MVDWVVDLHNRCDCQLEAESPAVYVTVSWRLKALLCM